MIVYPMGLPPHEEVQAMLDDDEDLAAKPDGKIAVPPEACVVIGFVVCVFL